MSGWLRLGAGAGLAVTAILYGYRIADVPAQLGWDEVFFALNAHSIATTARDVEGNVLPLYFHFSGALYYLPMIVYSMAASFTLLPVSEFSIRLPTLIMGLTNVVLAYFVGRTIFKREWAGVLSGALMAMTPAHYIHSRFALDYVFPLPFIFVWLWCLAAFLDRPRPWLIAGGVLSLGIGFYSYMAAVVMMPFYFVLTLVVIVLSAAPRKPRYLAEALVFAIPLVLVMVFAIRHPTFYADQIVRYRVYDVKRFTLLQGIKEFLNYQNLTHRVSMYWDYNGPNYLFMSGGIKMTMTTRRAGVFLMTLAVFLPVGMYQSIVARRNVLAWLLVAGFLTAPLAALLVDDPYAIDRELNLLPFGVLLATAGVVSLMNASRLWVRAMTVVLLLLTPVAFAAFYRDYFSIYRMESAAWFERNIRGAIEETLSRTDRGSAGQLYVNNEIGNVESYWRLYLIKHGRDDLLARTRFFKPATLDLATVPAGALIVSSVEDPWQKEKVASGEIETVFTAREPDGAPSYLVLRRL
jgi:4-amino-4-deoxy-L-arabinose transferase-like glycosyltransferase